MKKYILNLVFILIIIGEMTAAVLGMRTLDFIFKPMIMLWIGGYFFLYAVKAGPVIGRLAFGAFFFSWMGDILLMFSSNNFLFFMLGLVSFLLAHIFYIFLFLQTIRMTGKTGYLKRHFLWLSGYLIYGVVFYAFLFSRLDNMLRMAVFVYLTAILSMSALALHRKETSSIISFRLVFASSLFFIFSDSLIALNKFLLAVSYERILVMSTYVLAQYLIMRGLLQQFAIPQFVSGKGL